jgi:hypothetical protein
VYAVVAIVLYLLRGTELFERHGISLTESILMYLGAGAGAGALVGVLRPLARTREGAMLVGAVVMVPVCIGFGLLMFGSLTAWRRPEIYGVITSAVILGALGGFQSYTPPHR